ncbi:MAG: CheR family methyltransferase, partial [Spirochaetota bacterium]
KDLLIGVTRFFRDAEAFESLKDTAALELLKKAEDKTQLRLWCMACSTGEEAYSLAILFYEKMQELGIDYDVKIFATDIDRDSIEYAGLGIYPESIVTDVSQERLYKFFTKKENTFQVNPEIRRMVIFANHNVLQDPPFSAIDMVSCRNMLIYLKPEMQQRVLGAFHFSVKQNGFLFLGSSETVGELSGIFSLIDTKWKIYQCKQKSAQNRVTDYFVPPVQPNKTKQERFPQKVYTQKNSSDEVLESAYDYLVHEFVPPSIIIDRNLTLIHVCREASEFMKIPTGKISLNVLEMLPNGIKAALSTAVHKALKDDGPVTYRDLTLQKSGETRYIDLSVKPILDRQNNPIGYFLVVFEDHEGTVHKTDSKEKSSFDEQQNKMIADLEQELQFTKENLQATIEELETSNEELQATNEELIASNEELQSTNEELQSVNEELYTVNAEYQNKIEELSEANNDLKNFLNNTDIGMVFLDKDFKIRKYTPAVTEVINIMEMDVGRPIEHITRNMKSSDFMEDVRSVLINLVPVEKEIYIKTGKWYLMKILPYRTVNNVVEGIVITFLDINEKKQFEDKLEKERDLLMRILENSPVAKTMVDREGNVVFANQKAAEIFGISREEILQRSFGDRGWKITDYEGKHIPIEELPFSKIMQTAESVYNYKHAVAKPDGTVIYLSISGSPLFSEQGEEVDGAVFSIQEDNQEDK